MSTPAFPSPALIRALLNENEVSLGSAEQVAWSDFAYEMPLLHLAIHQVFRAHIRTVAEEMRVLARDRTFWCDHAEALNLNRFADRLEGKEDNP